jgi:hypothetical protein
MPIYTDSFDSKDSFWSNPTSEPKRKYRFTFDVSGLPVWTIKSVNRPSFNVSTTTHTFYNHDFKYPGKVTWQDITFTTVDPIHPDATGILMKMLYASGYEFPDKQFGGNGFDYRSLNKVDAVDALNPVTITTYDGQGASVEKWTLKNAYIVSANMGNYDYNDQNMLEMTVGLAYDWATIERLDGRAQLQTSLDKPPVPDSAVGP